MNTFPNQSAGNQLIHDDEARFFLASVINTLQDSVVTINLHGVITSWNASAEKLYGYLSAEAIGKSLELVTLPAEFDSLKQSIETIRNGQQIALYDTIRMHKDGRQMQIEVTLSPVKNHEGVVIGVSTVARDVSELRKAQQELASSETRLRAIVEAATDFAIITIDSSGRITDWNSGAEIMLGYSKEEAIGQEASLIFTPEDRQGGIPAAEIENARRTGRSFDERWHLRKDGTRFFMSGVMTVLDENGASGFVKVARNITDRKLAEEALLLSEQRKSLAVESAAMGEWEWSLASGEVKISGQVTALLGIAKDKAIQAPDALLARIYPGDEATVKQDVAAALSGLNILQTECRIVREDNGEIKWLNVYGRVVAERGLEPSRMIGVVYDITVRKQLEKHKDDFISLASHELKTPVTAIRTYSELLELRLEEKQWSEEISLVHKFNAQVERLVKLIQDMLDVSTISEGRLKLKPEIFNLNDMVTEQLPMLESIALHHTIQWRPSAVSSVHADKERIIQVVSNYVSNAAKYSPHGTLIEIRTEDKGDHALLSVKDRGIGIPEDAHPFVFDRYYRADKTGSYKGFGLGLFICAEIIRGHGGTIGLSSQPGEGSTFYFTLPYS